MKYNIFKSVRNMQEAYSASVSATFDDINKAKVNYHQTLAALHNANDVKVAAVKIVDEFGHDLEGYIEKVEHVAKTKETETK